MVSRKLAGNRIAYYWQPRPKDVQAGCTLKGEPLGSDYGAARKRANELNEELDAWRAGIPLVTAGCRIGTVEWWFHIYQTETQRWRNLRERSRPGYLRSMRIVADLPLKKPAAGRTRIGELPVKALTPAAADKLYQSLLAGYGNLKPNRYRQAELEIDICKVAWDAVQRLYPEQFPTGKNPFVGITRVRRAKATTKPATREEAYALAYALRENGYPHLGACALIAYEWHQRPENVLSGATTWRGYEPGHRVRIEHWKTDPGWKEQRDEDGEDNKHFWLELVDDDGAALYPEIEAYLAELPRLGIPIVLRPVKRRQKGQEALEAVPYLFRTAHNIVKTVREKAGLPDHLTLGACRHGGLTELGDAGVTEQEGMALSAHTTPEAFRLYLKHTRNQRLAGARKRLALRNT